MVRVGQLLTSFVAAWGLARINSAQIPDFCNKIGTEPMCRD